MQRLPNAGRRDLDMLGVGVAAECFPAACHWCPKQYHQIRSFGFEVLIKEPVPRWHNTLSLG